jgi:hypothetical protein
VQAVASKNDNVTSLIAVASVSKKDGRVVLEGDPDRERLAYPDPRTKFEVLKIN